MFHSREEVEGLYQILSEFAAMNNLVISRLEKKKIQEVSKSQAIAKASGKKQKKKAKKRRQPNKALLIIKYQWNLR